MDILCQVLIAYMLVEVSREGEASLEPRPVLPARWLARQSPPKRKRLALASECGLPPWLGRGSRGRHNTNGEGKGR